MPKRTDPDEVVDAQLSRRELTAAAVTQIERFGRAVDSYDWLNTADEWSAAELRAFRDAVAPMLTRAADMLEAAIGPDAEPCSVFAENPQSEADDADDE